MDPEPLSQSNQQDFVNKDYKVSHSRTRPEPKPGRATKRSQKLVCLQSGVVGGFRRNNGRGGGPGEGGESEGKQEAHGDSRQMKGNSKHKTLILLSFKIGNDTE